MDSSKPDMQSQGENKKLKWQTRSEKHSSLQRKIFLFKRDKYFSACIITEWIFTLLYE